MVERIRLLLEVRQLSPTQFADAIGIARPIVSHILSGRNKPSLEVVQRILAAMPDLSMAWLLNGAGPMLAAGVATVPPAVAPVPIPQPVEPAKAPEPAPNTSSQPVESSAAKPTRSRQPSLQSASEPVRDVITGNRAIPRRFTAQKPAPELGSKAESSSNSQTHAAEPMPAPVPEPMPAPPVAAEPASAIQPSPAAAFMAGSDKPIRRIVIFYRDGSFADFQPE